MDEEKCLGLVLNCVITSIYIPTLLIVLNYTDTLYYLGKRPTYIEWVLVGAEIMKYLLCHRLNAQENKKPKRSSEKLTFKQFLESFMTLIIILFAFYFGAVIFGAPVLSQHYETFFFSLLMTILTALPCILHVNLEHIPTLFLSIFEGTDIHPHYFWNIRLTVLGSWLGAVIIPLDWDRPYQKWPIPCSIGALGGCYLANVFSLLGRRFFKRKPSKFNLCEFLNILFFGKYFGKLSNMHIIIL